MVSRRDFLLTNGTILAAAGLGFGLPGRAAAAERDSHTLCCRPSATPPRSTSPT
ncbi:hypothetical protein ACWCP8_05585 [Streptomyces sp. NPDC002206]